LAQEAQVALSATLGFVVGPLRGRMVLTPKRRPGPAQRCSQSTLRTTPGALRTPFEVVIPPLGGGQTEGVDAGAALAGRSVRHALTSSASRPTNACHPWMWWVWARVCKA